MPLYWLPVIKILMEKNVSGPCKNVNSKNVPILLRLPIRIAMLLSVLVQLMEPNVSPYKSVKSALHPIHVF